LKTITTELKQKQTNNKSIPPHAPAPPARRPPARREQVKHQPVRNKPPSFSSFRGVSSMQFL